MKAPVLVPTLMLLASITACAALRTDRPPEQNADFRLERGLLALDAARYVDAFDDLAWVYSHCSGRQAGSRALIALAALELDARNDRGRPAVGTELLGRVISDPGAPRWVRPLAETAFLETLALGARPPAGGGGVPAGERADSADQPVEEQEAIEKQALGEEHPDSVHHDPDAQDHDAELPPAVVKAPAVAAENVYGCGPAVAVEGWVAPALPELPGPSMAALLATSETRRDTLRKELAAVKEQLQATRAELERIRKTLKP